MKKKIVYDYYDIEIPDDMFDEDDTDARWDFAIDQARERARLYTVPCNWTVIADDGKTVKIRRERYATK